MDSALHKIARAYCPYTLQICSIERWPRYFVKRNYSEGWKTRLPSGHLKFILLRCLSFSRVSWLEIAGRGIVALETLRRKILTIETTD